MEQQQKPRRKITLKKKQTEKTEEEIIKDNYNMWQFNFSFFVFTPIPKEATDVYFKWGYVYFTHNNEKKKVSISTLMYDATKELDYEDADNQKITDENPVFYGFDELEQIENAYEPATDDENDE